MTGPVIARLREAIAATESKIASLSVMPAVDEYPDGQAVRALVLPRWWSDEERSQASPRIFLLLKTVIARPVDQPEVARWDFATSADRPWQPTTGLSRSFLTYADIVEWAVQTVIVVEWTELLPDTGDPVVRNAAGEVVVFDVSLDGRSLHETP